MLRILALIMILAGSARAATFTAADCERATINTIIANDINPGAGGDTLVVPPGYCTWTAALTTFTKGVTLKGYGAYIYIDGVSSPINFGTAASCTLEGFKIEWSGVPSGTVMVAIRGQTFRVTRNYFLNTATGGSSTNPAVFINGGTSIDHPTGVVDHNYFDKGRVLVYGNAAIPGNPGADPEPWRLTSSIGNTDQTGVVYVEDNYFTRTDATHNATDSQYGGRYVFRYNTVVNGSTECHSVNGNERGCRSFEIYQNDFSATIEMQHAFFQRAGTGVIWGNTIAGTNYIAGGFKFDNIRSYTNVAIAGCCDGLSSWDGNVTVGYPCRDQIGRGIDSADWPTSTQVSDPVYEWSNTRNGVNWDPTVVNNGTDCKAGGSSADIISGTDYIVDTEKPGYLTHTYPYPGIGSADQQRPNVRKRGGF